MMQRAFIKTARAKGLHEAKVILDHAFKNAMLPVVTFLAFSSRRCSAVRSSLKRSLPPGIGRLLVDSILSRDYPVVQAVVLFIRVDGDRQSDGRHRHGFLDPRIRET